MINAKDLLLECWIANNKGFNARVTTLLPHYRKKQSSGEFEWHINGETEDCWSGIQLEPKMLVRNGFRLQHDIEWIISYGLPNNFFVTWMVHNSPYGPDGTIIAGPDERPIQYVHQLQLRYFAATDKHLQFDL